MSRLSNDEYRNGTLWNGFDYMAQAWVVNGIYQMCGHPASMRRRGPCCPAARLAGQSVKEARA